MHTRRLLLSLLWLGIVVHAQEPKYDFYPEFRSWSVPLLRSDHSLSREQVIERYVARLRAEGVADAEIQRRSILLKGHRNELEDDFWNRYFTQGTANYNHAPNSFLVDLVAKRKPGTALDYGMGEGRNALYLAKLGWRVSGFDPAAAAVALAEQRARQLGLTLDAKTVRDDDYDFGHSRFDLVLFSWTMPNYQNAQKVVESLKPGGLVIMECGADWVGRNEMLKLFDKLQITRYEIVPAQSDFFNRREMEVLRLVARRPDPAPVAP